MWVYPQPNLASFHELSSSCLALCWSLYSRARRDKARQALDRGRAGGRRIAGGGTRSAGPASMDDALGYMPITLQHPVGEDEEMDPEIWGRLPDELLDRVLACLPVPLLLQLRSVCRRWKEVIISPTFSTLTAQMHRFWPHFWVFEFHKFESSVAYDPLLHKWYDCPSQIPAPISQGRVVQVCADGGLLCVVVRSKWFLGHARILLCNPAARTYRELPQTRKDRELAARGHRLDPILVALVADQVSNSFQVVAAGACSCPHAWSSDTFCFCRFTEVYDSRTDRWERVGDLPWVQNESSNQSRTYAVCGDNLFCLGFSRCGDDIMMVFNLKRREWRESQVSMPSLTGNHTLLFERRGSLVLVRQAQRFCGLPRIFTWVPTSNQWTPVRMLLPREGRIFAELFHYDEDLLWVGYGDNLFFVSSRWDQAILYDISSKSWTITPKSKFLRRHSQVILPLPFDFSLQVHCRESTTSQLWQKY